MKRRTKIVATLGPASGSPEMIQQLVTAGLNVARLNCSHGDWEAKNDWIKSIRACKQTPQPVALLADLQGPKFRIGTVEDGMIDIRPGQSLTLGQDSGVTLPVPDDEIFEAMRAGDRLLLGDGDVELKLGTMTGATFEAKALTGGKVRTRQGVTLVGKSFSSPSLTEKDKEDVYEACRSGVDIIALSYVREAVDMRELRRLVDKYDPSIKLCAKIETKEALKHIDEILKVSDIVMVARGDLGLQMDFEDVPLAQKRIIRRANIAGKPVITATQMLESMILSARPTRAEATDVANAILDGTDAVMMSGETATGAYPLEALKAMARIAEKAETLFDHESRLTDPDFIVRSPDDPTEAVAHAAVELSRSLKAKAIVTTSTSGLTPRMVSKYRPKCPIYCASWNSRTHAQLSAVWGVEALAIDLPESMDDTIGAAIDAFMKARLLKVGDTVVVTAGVPAGKVGNTNLIFVQKIK